MKLNTVRNKKMENLSLPYMKELYEINFPPVYDQFFFCRNLTCGPEFCKQDGMMKTRLATNIDGYHLRLVLLL